MDKQVGKDRPPVGLLQLLVADESGRCDVIPNWNGEEQPNEKGEAVDPDENRQYRRTSLLVCSRGTAVAQDVTISHGHIKLIKRRSVASNQA